MADAPSYVAEQPQLQADARHQVGWCVTTRVWDAVRAPSRQGTSCRFPDCVCEELSRFADMSGKRRPARKSEAEYSPHEETAKHRDLPKLFGQELQAHFKPLRDLPHRMFTLLLRLKNIRAPRGERRSTPPGGSGGIGGRA